MGKKKVKCKVCMKPISRAEAHLYESTTNSGGGVMNTYVCKGQCLFLMRQNEEFYKLTPNAFPPAPTFGVPLQRGISVPRERTPLEIAGFYRF